MRLWAARCWAGDGRSMETFVPEKSVWVVGVQLEESWQSSVRSRKWKAEASVSTLEPNLLRLQDPVENTLYIFWWGVAGVRVPIHLCRVLMRLLHLVPHMKPEVWQSCGGLGPHNAFLRPHRIAIFLADKHGVHSIVQGRSSQALIWNTLIHCQPGWTFQMFFCNSQDQIRVIYCTDWFGSVLLEDYI